MAVSTQRAAHERPAKKGAENADFAGFLGETLSIGENQQQAPLPEGIP